MTKPVILALLAVSLATATATAASPCRDGTQPRSGKARPDCPPPRKFEPYDPDAVRAGSRPGFIDLGGGTEVRVGGRVRGEFDTRR